MLRKIGVLQDSDSCDRVIWRIGLRRKGERPSNFIGDNQTPDGIESSWTETDWEIYGDFSSQEGNSKPILLTFTFTHEFVTVLLSRLSLFYFGWPKPKTVIHFPFLPLKSVWLNTHVHVHVHIHSCKCLFGFSGTLVFIGWETETPSKHRLKFNVRPKRNRRWDGFEYCP